MATVYRAYEAGLDRYVALKVLPEDSLENETAVKRFKLEARAVTCIWRISVSRGFWRARRH